MKCRRCHLVIILLAALFATLPGVSLAGAYTYNSGLSQRTVNAGILTLASELNVTGPKGIDNPDPYVFYVLSKRTDVIPYGWSIVNPLAPLTVTTAVKARWDARDASNPYSIAQAVTPDMGAYWEVPLATSTATDLQQYDVLLLDLKGGPVQFSVADAEKLRRFVDGGGTLWIDAGSSGTIGDSTGNNSLFLNLIAFQSVGTVPTTSPVVTGPPAPPSHSLVTTPYTLTQAELDNLVNGNYSISVANDAQAVLTPVMTITGSSPIVYAGAYGAGAVVVTSTSTATRLNVNLINNVPAQEVFSAYVGSVQPPGALAFPMTAALKFVANLIAWNGGHAGEHQSSHQQGADFNSFPSPVRLWNGGVTGGASAIAPAPAIYGNLGFVTDASGVLHAFNLSPGMPSDLGLPDYSASSPTSYDEVWRGAVGTYASAPSIINNNGQMVVAVEKADGSVAQYDMTGAAGPPLVSGTGGAYSTGNAPAPVAFNGVLYALQANGSLSAYDLANAAALGTYAPSLSTTAPVATGAPAVGLMPVDGTFTGFTPPANDLLAFVPTSQYLYSVFLGSRGEQLHQAQTLSDYVTKLQGASKIQSILSTSTLGAYQIDQTTGFALLPRGTTLDSNSTTFTGLAAGTTYFADYNTDLANSGSDLTRTQVGVSSETLVNGGASGTISSPALDRFGNSYYITTNTLPGGTISTLVSFHDSFVPGDIRLNWRFRLPSTLDGAPLFDADGVDYAKAGRSLTGYVFQGAPVVDERANVYALATNGTNAAILCFNGLQPVTIASPLMGFDLIAQPIPAVPVSGMTAPLSVDEFGLPADALTEAINPGQVNGITLTNFGKLGTSVNKVTRTLYPDVSEPQALAVAVKGTTAAPTYVPALLHTNLAWYTILPDTVTASILNTLNATSPGATLGGLTKAGGSLFLVDGAGHLISVIADPTSAGIPIINKYVDSTLVGATLPSMVTDYGDTGAGQFGAVPAIADGALLVNGQKGIAGYANRVTVVADGSRVLELSSSGDATWLVDSTTGAAPGSTLATAIASVGVPVSLGTSLELNHPSAVTEIAANDYLVADTGNNRCVRFSRSGQTLWELSRVNDESIINSANGDDVGALLGKASGSAKLIASNEPATLNQPTGVQIYTQSLLVGTNNYTVVHYLISDSGNYRVLEVVDVFDSNGLPVGTPHNVIWVSHTHDKQQRNYRYQSAAYFPSASNPVSVVALVTNVRIATTSAGGGSLSASNQDAPGGSIVLLDHGTGAASGYPTGIFTSFQAPLTQVGNTYAFDIQGAVTGNGINRTLYLRNPRYLKAYTPQNAPNSKAFLLADDNGVFDLVPNAAGSLLNAQWGYTQADYQTMTTPISAGAVAVNSVQTQQVPFNRTGIPFIPGSIQRTSTDQIGNYAVGHYIVTNSYSGGEASSIGGFGGEVFELGVVNIGGGTLQTKEVHDNPLGNLGLSPFRYLGTTFSRPTNTGALVQPTFAYRVP